MAVYTCPTCGEKMERDLSLFMDHTDKHIVDEVKRLHPSWITADGFCPRCLEYYKSAGQSESTNLDAKGIQQRMVLCFIGFGGGAAWWIWFQTANMPPIGRLGLFPLFFAGFLGLLQAKRKLCVVIAQKQSEAMKRKAAKILLLSALLAAALTAASLVDFFKLLN